MKVIISAGGTGGHIYPALAIINKIKEKEPQSEFLYIGTHNRMEKDIVPQQNIPFKAIEMYGFNSKKLSKNFKTIKCLISACQQCKKIIKNFNPDIVIGVGGYVTVPVIRTAHKLGYKTFIHEQNSIPGKANLYLSKYADIVGVSMKSTLNSFPHAKTIFTGNPCSEDAIHQPAIKKEKLGFTNKPLVLFVMGSLGSSKMNEILLKTMIKFKNKPYQILYITGNNFYSIAQNYKLPNNVKILPFYENLAQVMKVTDLIVSRAGASTLSEIIALKIPSILIPSPYVPNNHQYKNAMDLVNAQASIMIEEANLTGDTLVQTIDKILNNKVQQLEMKKKLTTLGLPNSAETIYQTIKNILE